MRIELTARPFSATTLRMRDEASNVILFLNLAMRLAKLLRYPVPTMRIEAPYQCPLNIKIPLPFYSVQMQLPLRRSRSIVVFSSHTFTFWHEPTFGHASG